MPPFSHFRQVTLLFTVTITLVLFNTAQGNTTSYLTLEELIQQYPAQASIGKNFKKIVDSKGTLIAPGIQNQPVRIAIIYPGKQVSDYWRRSVLSLKKRMDEIGMRYEISEFFSHSGDIRLQEAQLRKALTADPDYLVYTMDVERHKRLVERLIHKGRPKIILQNITTPIKEWQHKQPFLYVGFDHLTGTRLLLESMAKQLSQGGEYGVLFHSQGYVSKMRGDTFIRMMKTRTNWHLKDSYYTDGEREKAKYATLNLLTDPQLRLIYSCATDTTFGALDALIETGKLGDVIINGWGGGSSELQAIRDGKLDLTVMRINDDNGVAMAEAIRLDLEEKTDQVPIVFSGDFVVVKKGITAEQLHSLEERSFRYSGR